MHIILDMTTSKVVTPIPLGMIEVQKELLVLTNMFPDRSFSIYYLFATGL